MYQLQLSLIENIKCSKYLMIKILFNELVDYQSSLLNFAKSHLETESGLFGEDSDKLSKIRRERKKTKEDK